MRITRPSLQQGIERRAEGTSDLAVTVLASISIAVPLLFYLHQHVEMLRYGYEIEALEKRKVALVERHRELTARRDSAAQWTRVEEQALRLGLVAPEPGRVLVAGEARGGPDSVVGRLDRPVATCATEGVASR